MKQPTKINLDKDKILAQLTRLSKIAKKEDWKLEYDAGLDELVFGKETMPKNSFLFNISKELNLFLTPSSNVNGIFIEYFSTNYLEHNEELRPILKILEEQEKSKKAKTEDRLDEIALENGLIIEAMDSLFNNKEELVTAV